MNLKCTVLTSIITMLTQCLHKLQLLAWPLALASILGLDITRVYFVVILVSLRKIALTSDERSARERKTYITTNCTVTVSLLWSGSWWEKFQTACAHKSSNIILCVYMYNKMILKALTITSLAVAHKRYSVLYKSQRPTFHLSEWLLHLHLCGFPFQLGHWGKKGLVVWLFL